MRRGAVPLNRRALEKPEAALRRFERLRRNGDGKNE